MAVLKVYSLESRKEVSVVCWSWRRCYQGRQPACPAFFGCVYGVHQQFVICDGVIIICHHMVTSSSCSAVKPVVEAVEDVLLLHAVPVVPV